MPVIGNALSPNLSLRRKVTRPPNRMRVPGSIEPYSVRISTWPSAGCGTGRSFSSKSLALSAPCGREHSVSVVFLVIDDLPPPPDHFRGAPGLHVAAA